MRRRLLLLASLCLLLPVAACDEPTGPDGLRISVANQHVDIENVGDDPVYTVAFDLELLATVDLAPPCIAESCGRILPGATRRYTYEELATAPGSTVRVFYWRAVLDGLTPVPGPMHHRDIPIPPIAFP